MFAAAGQGEAVRKSLAQGRFLVDPQGIATAAVCGTRGELASGGFELRQLAQMKESMVCFRSGCVGVRLGARLISGVIAAFAAGGAMAQPANDLCSNALQIDWQLLPATTAPVSIAQAQPLAETEDPCTMTGWTVWYTFLAAASARLEISTCAQDNPLISLADTTLALYESADGSCNGLSAVWCNDDQCGFRSLMTYDVTQGKRYFVQAGQFRTTPPVAPVAPDDVVTISIRVLPAPADDTWAESPDAGASVETAQVVATALPPVRIEGELDYDGDIDLYRLEVCEPGPVTATTVGGASLDTQLFLFGADGTGIVMNDDDPLTLSNQSRLQLPDGLVPGAYLLAVSSFNLDPLDGSQQPMWNDEPYRTQRAPDGPGAGGIVTSWRAQGGLRGRYTLLLSGWAGAWTCTSDCAQCVADFNQDGGVDGSDIAAFFEQWESGLECADTNADGGIDGSDIEAFILAWESGGC